MHACNQTCVGTRTRTTGRAHVRGIFRRGVHTPLSARARTCASVRLYVRIYVRIFAYMRDGACVPSRLYACVRRRTLVCLRTHWSTRPGTILQIHAHLYAGRALLHAGQLAHAGRRRGVCLRMQGMIRLEQRAHTLTYLRQRAPCAHVRTWPHAPTYPVSYTHLTLPTTPYV